MLLSHQNIRTIYRLIIGNQICNHLCDLIHEFLCGKLFLLHTKKLHFPISRHGRRLDLFRHNCNQRKSLICCSQVLSLLITLAGNETGTY